MDLLPEMILQHAMVICKISVEYFIMQCEEKSHSLMSPLIISSEKSKYWEVVEFLVQR